MTFLGGRGGGMAMDIFVDILGATSQMDNFYGLFLK